MYGLVCRIHYACIYCECQRSVRRRVPARRHLTITRSGVLLDDFTTELINVEAARRQIGINGILAARRGVAG